MHIYFLQIIYNNCYAQHIYTHTYKLNSMKLPMLNLFDQWKVAVSYSST